MATSRLTVTLPESEINFIKKYAKKNKISVSELLVRWIKNLKTKPTPKLHPDIKKFTGIIAPDINAEESYAEYVMDKHT
jgi:hypothetical protein